jgi:hypothetical protein
MDTRKVRARVRRVLPWVTAAVAVLLASLLGWKLTAANPADAVLARALQAAGDERDRTYDVIDTWGEPGQSQQTAVLQVRGGQFVFRPLTAPWEGTLVGGDGRENWMVPAAGAVRTSDDAGAFLRVVRGGALPARPGEARLTQQREPLPSLNLLELLRLVSRCYDLKRLPTERLGEEGEGCQHLSARRRGDVGGGPAAVEVWVRAETGAVRRLVLHLGEGPGARRLTLNFQSEERLPADWYGHAAHHDAGRPVRPWPAQRERGGQSPNGVSP